MNLILAEKASVTPSPVKVLRQTSAAMVVWTATGMLSAGVPVI